ncbi:MAG: NADP-dependent malic enzyme [Candidatus Neomarinimicrobiota bacterium]
MITKNEALNYHAMGRPGKIEVQASKPFVTQRDLSLAYTPGVAEPCREIYKDPSTANLYTAKANLVGVISNGSAVLGLGDIGALAGKPVMEGKGVLFKRFADIDVFDIELNTKNVDEIIMAVKLMEPTFGGINLEDIKAPECFEIEERLIKEMNIPVFHDDQHGTAIISAAALINAAELVDKKLEELRIVISGAGASAVACATHYIRFGVKRRNILMVDSKGVVYKDRSQGMNKYKRRFAADTSLRTLAEAMRGADVFIGLSRGGLVTGNMVKSMAKNPIVFAMANPDPEITYPEAKAARSDVIMATGRSDYPNQVNNVLGFPFIFRGALDVHAIMINDEMKIAASRALANLAKEDVPDEVASAYGEAYLEFGPDYIIPKPFDPRVLIWEASAVAEAAINSGVAGINIEIDRYRDELEARLGASRELMRNIIHTAQESPKRIVFPEGESERIIRASFQLHSEGIAKPILIGQKERVAKVARKLHIDLKGVEIIDPIGYEKIDEYRKEIYQLRQRKGITRRKASNIIKRENYFGSMMVHMGDADGLVSGIAQNYADTLRPALQIIRTEENVDHVAGMYLLVFKNKLKLLADVTVNIDPDAKTLAEIAILTSHQAKKIGVEPKIAMLSFSNFGSVKHPQAAKVREALKIVRELDPNLNIDGEMHADVAVSTRMLEDHFPFSALKSEANVLIFPDLMSGNSAYKLLTQLGGATAIGPILMGFSKPVHLLQMFSSTVEDIVNMTALTVVDAQSLVK